MAMHFETPGSEVAFEIPDEWWHFEEMDTVTGGRFYPIPTRAVSSPAALRSAECWPPPKSKSPWTAEVAGWTSFYRTALALAQIQGRGPEGLRRRARSQGRHWLLDRILNLRRPHQALANLTPMAVWRDGVTGALGEMAVS
jgi:hypothetical protein